MKIVNSAFGKCLSGTRCVNKMNNPTTAIKTITHDNYVRIFLNDSLSVFNNIFLCFRLLWRKMKSQPILLQFMQKKHEQHHCPTIFHQLPQTNMAFEPQKKTLNFRHTVILVVFTGIQRMFFLIIPTWPGMITPQILYPQQAPDLVTPAPLVVDLDLVTPQWWSSCLRFKQKQEVKHRKTGQKR